MIYGLILTLVGFIGLVSRKSLVSLLVGLHIMVLGLSLFIVTSSASLIQGNAGIIFGLFVVVIQMVSCVFGLCLAVSVFRKEKTIQLNALIKLRD